MRVWCWLCVIVRLLFLLEVWFLSLCGFGWRFFAGLFRVLVSLLVGFVELFNVLRFALVIGLSRE